MLAGDRRVSFQVRPRLRRLRGHSRYADPGEYLARIGNPVTDDQAAAERAWGMDRARRERPSVAAVGAEERLTPRPCWGRIGASMTQTEAFNQVAMFNAFVGKKLWLDVDVVECSPESVVLHGGIDLSVGPDVEIRFDTIFFVSLLMTWRTDTSSPILKILTGEDACRINRQYRIEQGRHLFAFLPEDFDEARCLIAAGSFCWRVIETDNPSRPDNPPAESPVAPSDSDQ